MKKVLAIIIAAALCLTFCACGKVFNELKDSAETAAEASETAAPKMSLPGIEPTVTRAEATPKPENSGARTKPEKTEEKSEGTEASTEEPAQKSESDEAAPLVQQTEITAAAKTVTETVTPVISAAKYAYKPVVVTKSPTSEVVYEGGSASFVAYANNATAISWLIINPNGKDFFEASSLAKSLPGLSISGTASDTLTIGCIPISLDGWYIQAKFYGEGGPVHSSMARLTVWPYPSQGVGTTCDPFSCTGTCEPWGCGGNWNPFAGSTCCEAWSCTGCPW